MPAGITLRNHPRPNGRASLNRSPDPRRGLTTTIAVQSPNLGLSLLPGPLRYVVRYPLAEFTHTGASDQGTRRNRVIPLRPAQCLPAGSEGHGMTDRSSASPAQRPTRPRHDDSVDCQSRNVATRSLSRSWRVPALLSALALVLGVVVAQTGSAGADGTTPAPPASAAATVHVMRAPVVTATVVKRTARVASTATRVRGRTSTSTHRGKLVVVVRVQSSSVARATATVSDGEVTGVEVRTGSVTRFATSSQVVRGSLKNAMRAAAHLAHVASSAAADRAATASASASAIAAATSTYRTRRKAADPAPTPAPTPSDTPSVTPTDAPPSAAPTSSSVSPSPTDTTAVPSVTPTTSSPTPTPPPPPVNPYAMPTGNLPGWTQVFADDFTTAAPLGSFLSAYGSRWGAYPSPWKDTSGHGVYNPGRTMSATGGMTVSYTHLTLPTKRIV